MTIDAMHWVWHHSRTRGNPRLALLHVADQVRTQACEIRLSTADFMRALNVSSRDTASTAVKAAVNLGELEIKEPGRGSVPPLYRLPKAVGYRRGDAPAVPESGTQSGEGMPGSVPESGTPDTDLVPEFGTQPPRPPVPESGTPRTEIREGLVPDFGDHFPSPLTKSDRANEEPSAGGIPAFARDLVDRCTAAGIIVRWSLSQPEWFKLHAALLKSGPDMLADHALKIWHRRRGDIDSARYLLRAWCELPPQPAPGTPAPKASQPPAEQGAFLLALPGGAARSTTDERVAQGLALAAQLRAEEQQAQEKHA